jgi:hypothetical protein
MTDEPVPDDVRSFIRAHINSVAQLEALLLLRREHDRAWDASSAAKRLYVSDGVARDILAQLHSSSLLTFEKGLYRYQPATAELSAMAERLAETYSRALIPVTNIVHGNPLRPREFDGAFEFRKEKDNK